MAAEYYTERSVDDLRAGVSEKVGALMAFLSSEGLPDQVLEELRALAGELQSDVVFTRAEDIGSTMAYMDHTKLVHLLRDGWESLANLTIVEQKTFQRKGRPNMVANFDAQGLPKLVAEKMEDEAIAEATATFEKLVADKSRYKIQFSKFRAMAKLADEQ